MSTTVKEIEPIGWWVEAWGNNGWTPVGFWATHDQAVKQQQGIIMRGAWIGKPPKLVPSF